MSSKKTPKVNGIFYDSVEYGGGLSENFYENLSKRNQIRDKKGKEEKKSKDIKKTKKDILKYVEKLNKFSSNKLNSLILTKGKEPIFNKKEQIKLIFDLYDLRDMNGCFISLRNPNSEKIKNSFKDLETDAICNLLGINPELNFYSKSQLLNLLKENYEDIFIKNEVQDSPIDILELSKKIYINNFAKKLGDDLSNIDNDWEDMPPVSKPKKQKKKKSSNNNKDKPVLEFDENGKIILPSTRKNKRKSEVLKTENKPKIELDKDFFKHIQYLIDNEEKILKLNEFVSETPNDYISKTIRTNLIDENRDLFLEWNELKSNDSFKQMKKEFLQNFKLDNNPSITAIYKHIANYEDTSFTSVMSKTLEKFKLTSNSFILDKTDLLNFLNFLRIYNDLQNYKNLEESKENVIAKANERFISNEIEENEEVFEVEDYVLDGYQKRAVVIDEDNMQIIAGAGTGKTSTLQGKLKYLTKVKGVKEEDILCLSYSNAAVDDLKEKIENTLDENRIEVKTFHSLGAGILKMNDDDSRIFKDGLKSCIRKYFKREIINNPAKIKEMVLFFSCYLKNPKLESEYKCGLEKNKNAQYKGDNSLKVKVLSYLDELGDKNNFKEFRKDFGGDNEKISFKDEYVRSLEELVIANFLFVNGINYVYEKKYSVKKEFIDSNSAKLMDLLFPECDYIPEEIKKQLIYDLNLYDYDYYPDFYLPKYDIYIEHYGVNEKCQARWLKGKARKRYKDSIKWKRNLHKMHETNLLETYSYYTNEGRLLSRLREKLEENKVEFKEVDYNLIYRTLLENEKLRDFEDLISLISKFINLFKGNGFNLDENGKDCTEESFKKFFEINEKSTSGFSKERNERFLNIIKEIYTYYSKGLKENNKIDFNDMINDAIKELRNGGQIHNYKYILVDEYQDTSKTRYNLLRAIQERTSAKIITVGDDWQSIYSFTGCDIKLFVNFDEYFDSPELIKIRNTYRNSQDLIDISSKFIQKNKKQIKKDLISEKHRKTPVKICHFDSDKESILILEDILKRIDEQDSNKKKKILILGRNNADINSFLSNDLFSKDKNGNLSEDGYLDIRYKNNPSMNIRFRTAHKSKGLQADYVILINLKDAIAGFPNKMLNDEIIDLFFKINPENIEFAEERRLFYVTLTRTKNDVYLLAPRNLYSSFIKELKKYNKINEKLIEIIPHFDFSDNDYNRLNLKANTGIETINTKLSCPNCKSGKVLLKINHDKFSYDNEPHRYFVCSNDFCDWRGGFYKGRIEDLEYIKNCRKCGGVLIVRNGIYGHFLGCTYYRKVGGCKNRAKLKPEIKKRYDEIYGIKK